MNYSDSDNEINSPFTCESKNSTSSETSEESDKNQDELPLGEGIQLHFDRPTEIHDKIVYVWWTLHKISTPKFTPERPLTNPEIPFVFGHKTKQRHSYNISTYDSMVIRYLNNKYYVSWQQSRSFFQAILVA